MRTALDQLEAVERLRSILTIRQFAELVGIDVAPVAGDKFDQYLDLTPDQIESEFGSSVAFRSFVRDKLAAQRDAAARQSFASPLIAVIEPLDDIDELGPSAAFEADPDSELTTAEAQLAEMREAVAAAMSAEHEAACRDEEAVFDGLSVEPLRHFAE